ncbi:SURF1 family protein [Oricola cellulosilytica]|uniref:SURF1-like protein n=1 Tax=Oricola cellulosilytica TaxID=1429082 RepID=A0A4R0PBQ5_9HYPH|nr:SURF1 family protein [Oricola cellulosilytica]TCD13471.1 SURF1 family protein [Oricola cellulosilytica]
MKTDTQQKSAGGGRKRFPWILLLLVAFSFAVLISLGNWQVRRLAWKEDLLAKIEARISAEPVTLSAVEDMLKAGEDVEYLPVTVEGTFDHADEQHMLATWNGASGWYVYTPMAVEDGGYLFVNRGFVPYALKEASARPESLPEGAQTITGLARMPLSAKPGSLLPDNAPDRNQYYWKDLSAMSAAAGLDSEEVVPLFVDAARDEDPQRLPIGGVTNISLPNSHLQYALTWYGLAGALLAVAGVFLWRRR